MYELEPLEATWMEWWVLDNDICYHDHQNKYPMSITWYWFTVIVLASLCIGMFFAYPILLSTLWK